MAKRVLDVGQCGPDHWAIESFLRRNFDCELDQADGTDDTLAMVRSGSYDLVLVNRKLDIDYSDGIDVIRALKADPAVAAVPVMLVTNYPEHQEEAVAAGAIRGFGKLEFGKPETRDRVGAVLGA
ncbi:MAG TPA: response regulator [Lacipirellulaceae bacterium]|jgi:CheY-like chemotaxis protein|nr:response regulator [Lacipirellulaceae bacterium]